MNRKVWMSVLIICLALAAIIGGTLAWFTSTATIGPNVFTAGTLEIEAGESWAEDYEVTNWNPGDCTDKEVKVKITGTKKAFLRMKIDDGWYEDDGEEGWQEWTPTADVISMKVNGNTFPTAGWTLIDGWYYYAGENLPGAEITVISKVCLAGSAGNDFQGKQYRLGFEFEAIQTSHDAAQDEWGVTWNEATGWAKYTP